MSEDFVVVLFAVSVIVVFVVLVVLYSVVKFDMNEVFSSGASVVI